MDKQTVQAIQAACESSPLTALAVSVFVAVIEDNPQAARIALAGASFRDRALIAAWADELERLSKQAMVDYENRERQAWRDVMDAPLSAL